MSRLYYQTAVAQQHAAIGYRPSLVQYLLAPSRVHWQNVAQAHAIPVAQEAAGAVDDTELQQQRARKLRAWVVQNSSGTLPTNVTPKPDTSTGGFSMITLEPVQRGQVLVRVPRTLMLTAAVAQADKEYGHLVTEGPLTEWQALVLALLCERARGEASFWAPYIAQLPEQLDHPLAWGPERLNWLEGSPMCTTLLSRQQQVREDCEILQLVGANQLPLAQAWSQAHQGEELVTVKSVTWAAATLLSRAFSIDMTDDEPMEGDMSYFGSWSAVNAGNTNHGVGDVLAVVPWADTLSHCSKAGPESCLRFCSELQAASLCAHREYKPGEEVFDSYGPGLCPSDLLLDYGFVDPTNTNHRVEVDPQCIVAPAGKCARALLAALAQAHGALAPERADAFQEDSTKADVRLPVTCDGPDTTLLAWVRAALSSDAELIRAGWRVKAGADDVELACRVMGRLTQPTSAQSEARVLQVVTDHLQSRLAAYPSSREQDEQEAAQPTTSRPRLAVLMALASEKRALEGAIAALATWRQHLAEGMPVEELYDLMLEASHGEGDVEEGEEGWDNCEEGKEEDTEQTGRR